MKGRIYIYKNCVWSTWKPYEKGVKMPQISINISSELYEYKRKYGLNWRFMIEEGVRKQEIQAKYKILEEELLQIKKDLAEAEIQRKSAGAKLTAYINKYGIDEEILYKKPEEK